jgi:predicted ATP-grasp superfamily ATP-dependent carboligase
MGGTVRVFVTDGDNRAALAVTRSLGRLGHEVLVGERRLPALAQASRYCARGFVYPDPTSQSAAFVDRMREIVRTEQVDVLLPVADITTFLVAGARRSFPPACAVPLAATAVLERAADKVDITETARRLGVAVPRSIVVEQPGPPPAVDLPFPVVIKPHRSRVQTEQGWRSSSVSYAATPEALAADLAARPAHEFPLMIQERIVGPGVGVFACYAGGRAVALFGHRRLRERPPWGGVSVLAESVPLDPVARDYAVKLLDAIGWRGVAMVEFKRDLRDNLPKLMEINGRFWGSLQLAIDAGVDFPALLVQSVGSTEFTPPPEYRLGVRSRWLWGDFDSLLQTLRGRSAVGTRASRLAATLEFLKLWQPNMRYENPRLDDPGPWLYETRRRVGALLQAGQK